MNDGGEGPFIYRAIQNEPIPDPLPPPRGCPAIKWLTPPPHYRAIYGQEGITFLMAGDKDKIYFLTH